MVGRFFRPCLLIGVKIYLRIYIRYMDLSINNGKIDTCVLIPVHPPKYVHVRKCLESLAKFDRKDVSFDMFFCFSTHSDLDKYQKNVKQYEPSCLNVFYLILEDDDPHAHSQLYNAKEGEDVSKWGTLKNHFEKIGMRMTFPIIKKFFGLETILVKYGSKYKYAWVMDAEVLFWDPTGFSEASEDQCKVRKSVIAGKENLIHLLLGMRYRCSRDFFTSQQRKKLKPYKGFYWFSDVPIYDMSIVGDFLRHIEFNRRDKIVNKIRWSHFDHILYHTYCIIFHSYKVVHMKNYGMKTVGSLEAASLYDFVKACEKIYMVNWIWHKRLLEYKKCFPNDNRVLFKISYHVDRG